MTYFATEGTGCLLAAPQIGADDPGTGCLPALSKTEADDPGARSLEENSGNRTQRSPHQERVRHLLYGSLAGIERTIKILHTLGYADPKDWSDPMPTGKPNQWMVIMTKILVME
jgi:hypothetical protein